MIWIVLLIAIAAVTWFFYKRSSTKKDFISNSEPGSISQPSDEKLAMMTLDELSQYDGEQKPQVYLGLKNYVFDVTNSEFYGKGGSYSKFAGKEVSVNLSKMSFEERDYNQYGIVKLTQQEVGILEQWYQKFLQKYKKVGQIVASKKDD